ncbi:MAG: hypothetical protein AAF483_23185 [Planctomycetota bacterium]
MTDESAKDPKPAGEESFADLEYVNPPHPEVPNEDGQAESKGWNLLELLLDPRSLQWLMGIGGGLMVVGLVILLWMNDYITPPIAAVVLGLTNLACLGAGIFFLRYTKKELVGQALTLLSCLVMPLNLWYYSSNDLITIDGHLWIPALFMCGIYAGSAMMLKDKKFVYIFSAGVTLTGLLMIADIPPSPSMFWEIRLPSTFLILLGIASIHLERVFKAPEGAFSRKEFGSAFFRVGHLQLFSGLLLILGAQVAGDWLFGFGFNEIYQRLDAVPSPMCGELRWLALMLVAAASYAYVYSDVVVKKSGIYIQAAAFTIIWAEVLLVQMLQVELTAASVIIVLAITSIVANIVQYFFSQGESKIPGISALSLVLACLPLTIGFWEFISLVGVSPKNALIVDSWAYAGAMFLAAVAMRLGAEVFSNSSVGIRFMHFAGAALALMITACSTLSLLGVEQLISQAPMLMLMPIGYLLAANLYGSRPAAAPSLWIAHTLAMFLLAASVLFSLEHLLLRSGDSSNWLWMLVFVEAMVFYLIASRQEPSCLVAALGCAALGSLQVLGYFDCTLEMYLAVAACIGLCLMLFQRLLSTGLTVEELEDAGKRPRLFHVVLYSANLLTSVAMAAAACYGLFQFAAMADGARESIGGALSPLCALLVVVGFSSLLLSRFDAGRVWYGVISSVHLLLFAAATLGTLDLGPWQKVELFSVLGGLVLLALGHVGWYREQKQEAQSDMVGTALVLGSLMVTVPLAIATMIHRYYEHFVVLDEFGFLFCSVLLLVLGLMLQLRWTTIVGGGMTGLYFATFIVLVPWQQVNTVATAILGGGAVMFGGGLILAFYREQILALPEAIRARQGIFRVLDWR